MKLGTRVKMSAHAAKWSLEHPEVHFCGDAPDASYDIVMQMSILTLIGGIVKGTVIGYGSDGCLKVSFFVPDIGWDWAHYAAKDLVRL